MNIQEVLKLKNGTIVQNETTKKRYMVYDYFYRGNKYLVKYENKNHSSHTIKPGEIKELKEIIVPINEALVMAEYTVCMKFKEKDNFIYESEDGKLYKGMVEPFLAAQQVQADGLFVGGGRSAQRFLRRRNRFVFPIDSSCKLYHIGFHAAEVVLGGVHGVVTIGIGHIVV